MSKKYTAYIALFSLTISHHVCAQVMNELGTNNTPASSGFGYYQAPVAKDSGAKPDSVLTVPSNYSGFGYTQAKPLVNAAPDTKSTTSAIAALPASSPLINPNASNFGGSISTSNPPTTQALATTAQPVSAPVVQQNNPVISPQPTQQTFSNVDHINEMKKNDELASIQALSDYEENDPYSRRKSSFGHFQVNNSDEEPTSMYNNQNLELGKGLTLLPDDDIVGSNLRSGKTNVFGYKKIRKQKQNAFLIPGKRRTGLIVTASGDQFEKDRGSKDQATTPLDDNIDLENQSKAEAINVESVQITSVESPAPAPVAASKGGLLDSITSIATAVATVADTISGTKAPAPVDTKATVTKSSATVTPSTSSSSADDSNDTTASSSSTNESSATGSDTPPELKSIVTQEVSTQLPPLVQAEVARQLGQMNPNNVAQPIPVAAPAYDQPMEELPVFVAK